MNMTQFQEEYPTYTKEPVAKIGETGGTIVYIFPEGKACVKKGKRRRQGSSPETSEAASISAANKNSWKNGQSGDMGDRLVAAGVINATQLQVALYDQKAMNLQLIEVLIARGWADQETLDSVLAD